MRHQCLRFAQTPWEMAQCSSRVAKARAYIIDRVGAIADEALRAHICVMLLAVGADDSRLEVCARGATAPLGLQVLGNHNAGVAHTEAEKVTLQKLSTALPYDPTWAAPGAALSSHHCYPGGWALHTALNLQTALHMARQSRDVKGVECNTDYLTAAIVLHDWAKLKLLVWDEQHNLDADQGIGHHEIMLAECMLRELAPEVIRLAAGVHGGWWLRPETVRRSLARAGQWVGVDPIAEAYMDEAEDDLSLESWIARQAEVSWYAVTRQSVQTLEENLRCWHARCEVPGQYMRWRHAVYVVFDELQMVQKLARGKAQELELRLMGWTRDLASATEKTD